jgi:hypothetical protein
MVSSTCFKTECLSSGRRSYVQVWYSIVLYIHQYKYSCRFKTAYTVACNYIHGTVLLTFRKSAHHHTNQINQPTRCSSFTSLLLDVYVWLNMFRAPLRPSSGTYNCTRSLWFYSWSVAVGTLLVAVCKADHDQQRSNRHAPTVKPEAPSAVVRSWWWAERRPKHVEPHINVK